MSLRVTLDANLTALELQRIEAIYEQFKVRWLGCESLFLGNCWGHSRAES
jgi:hypothetical protein